MHTLKQSSLRAGTGLGFIVLAALLLALGDGVIKLVSNQITIWQLVLLRSVIAVPALLLLLLWRRRGSIWPKQTLWVGVRSLLLVGMWLLVYAALPSLDMPTVSAALYTSPLLICVLSAISSGRLKEANLSAVAIGFVGVLVLLRPGTDAFSPMLLLPLAAAVLYAFAALVTGRQCRDESPLAMSLAFNLCFLVIGAVGVLLLAWHPWSAAAFESSFIFGDLQPLGWPVLGVILVLAIIIVVANVSMARAYQIGPAPVIAAGDYSYLVFSALWSIVLFQTLPGLISCVGIGLILWAGLQSLGQGRSAQRPERLP